MDTFSVLKRPIVTEKSTLLQEQSKYVFEVDKRASKTEVKDAVERSFDVKVRAVRVLTIAGERKRRANGRWMDQRSIKKAVVTLDPGQSIQLFEGA
ncbi:MAG: 50S ribosomal protein L23 [Chloroflexota bacterium]